MKEHAALLPAHLTSQLAANLKRLLTTFAFLHTLPPTLDTAGSGCEGADWDACIYKPEVAMACPVTCAGACITDAPDNDAVAADLFGSASVGCAQVASAPQGFCNNAFIAFTCPVACKHMPASNECYSVGDYEVDQDNILFNQYGATCAAAGWIECLQPAVAMTCPVTCAAATSTTTTTTTGTGTTTTTPFPVRCLEFLHVALHF
jgi:hypothetical protein